VVVGDGLVLTNAHNVGGDEVQVVFGDGRTATARPAGVDVDGDLAVLAVDTGDAPAVDWTDDSRAGIGGVVFALANPGGRGLRVTMGLVSAVDASFRGPRGRRVTGSLEHTAPLVRGSSGGPVVDVSGRLAGINTNRLSEGFYQAIPADADLRTRVDALAAGESVTRRHLGVALVPSRAARHLRRSVGLPDRDGVLVRAVQDDSPAARAGLRAGDLIAGAGGNPVERIDDLHTALDRLGDNESLPLLVVRGVDELTVSVTFGLTSEEGSA
jgi:serine protease Do